MSIEHPITVGLTAAYFLGSIPFGYLLVRVAYGSDVRETGSGNIGATNVSRTSLVLGIITLLLDGLKGFAAVALVLLWVHGTHQLAFAAAFIAICGHMFPVWLGFRGGKGVATGLGSFAMLVPKAVLISLVVFLAMVAAFRWIAFGSIMASASLPALAWALGEVPQRTQIAQAPPIDRISPLVWLSAAALLIVLKHQANVRRMLTGTEPRFRSSHK
jgi:glycerol-3-phosphate acyltransferase PlsY